MKSLNTTNRAVLDFLHKFISKNGCAPSYKEIMEYTGIKTTSHVEKVLISLEEHGDIKRQKGVARSIVLNDDHSRFLQIPIFGNIAAGEPIPAPIDRHEQEAIWNDFPMIEISASELPPLHQGEKYFALKVLGDSMVEDGILDGDLVILYNPVGDLDLIVTNKTVAAWIVGDETMTLKHLRRGGDGSMWLYPANRKYAPRQFKNPEEELEIHGILVKLVRSYTH